VKLCYGVGVLQVALRGDVRIRFFLFDSKDVVPLDLQNINSAATMPTRRRGILGPGATTLKYGNVEGKMCFFIAFHTAFVEAGITSFDKSQIDEIYNYADTKYSKRFCIMLNLTSPPVQPRTLTHSAKGATENSTPNDHLVVSHV